MSKKEAFISHLIKSLNEHFLPSLAKREPQAINCLKKAHIIINEQSVFPLKFELGKFFEALLIWSAESGKEEPANMDWHKYFYKFEEELSKLWPDDVCTELGFSINKVRISNSKVRNIYEISNT